MGGFVQSAMMKRSDSVKRWSVNSPAGLQRADSVVASRPGHTRSKSMLREGSTTPTTSRPTSSHEPREREPAVQEKPDVKEKPEVQKKPAVKEVAKEVTPEAETKPDEEEIPVSPTKTMDPRRWSPTKSSWLDAQLNKPESPKAKQTPPTSHQPAWMVELNKAKAQKATVGGDDIDRSASVARKHEVKTGGLMRAPPMGIGVKPNSNGSGPLSPRLPSDDKTSNVSSLRGNLVKRPSETNMNEGGAAAVTAKIKPATPPKKDLDFRGNLKPRQAPAAGTSGPPDEFKNVFGGLRRTKTQNYVAPDELKNNILRGKAGLNNTGGPKPSERKDEFKEAILKKKEDFKKAQQEGHSVTKSPPLPQEKPALPEALAKKLEIKRSATVSKRELPSSNAASESLTGLGITAPNRSSTMSSFSKPEPETARPLPSPKLISAENEPPVMPTLHKEVSAPARLQGGLANRFNPALANILARGPPGAGAAPPKPSVEPASQTVAKETEPEASSGPGPKLTHMTKSRARGPKRKAPSSVAKVAEVAKSASSEASPVPALAPAASRTPIFKSPPLTQQERFEPKFETPKVSDPVKQDKPFPTPKSRVVSPVVPAKKFTLDKTPNISPLAERISLIDSSKKASEEDSKPASTPVFKPRARSPTKVADQIAALAAKSQDKTAEKKEESVSRPASPTKNVLKRISKFIDEPVPQQVGSPADTNKSLPPSPTKSLPPSPVKHRALPKPAPAAAAAIADKKKVDDEKVAAEPVVSVKNGRDLFGGNSASVFGVPTASKSAAPAPASAPATVAEPEPVSKVLPQRPRTPPRQLPQLSTRPLPAPPLMSPSLGSPNRSPMTKYNMEVNAMLTDFFGHARPQRTYNVDAAEILTHRPQTESTTTTRQAQLFQISADGKKVPVPGQHERVLFEREMYLCTHTFTSASTGKSASEVFFWTGDEVPSSATQDAHLFAQREARSFGGKLIKLTQGKETPEFLQALGGIVTIRRGSSNKYDSLAPVMLCGRRYHGQIVFDEVDFLPASLCSGFPYLIAQQGKCTLWKGKGSDVDELSCARLIGMDLALMSELEEVEDGEEPASFWDIFPSGGSRQGSADHWRLKPSYDRYCGRLFRSDARDRKQVCLTPLAHHLINWVTRLTTQQIIELTPFTQSDLLSSSIYILDAFFEMYIIVGARAQDQYASFHNALEFAQEYAILASGMEDRPFVPVCTVVLEGIPRDLKSVFRKWTDGRSPTVMHPPSGVGGTGLKRGRSLRVVPLNQALQALRE